MKTKDKFRFRKQNGRKAKNTSMQKLNEQNLSDMQKINDLLKKQFDNPLSPN